MLITFDQPDVRPVMAVTCPRRDRMKRADYQKN
jgi:hypothetical protein